MALNDTLLQGRARAGFPGNMTGARAASARARRPLAVDAVGLLDQTPAQGLSGAQRNERFLAAISQFRRHLPFGAR